MKSVLHAILCAAVVAGSIAMMSDNASARSIPRTMNPQSLAQIRPAELLIPQRGAEADEANTDSRGALDNEGNVFGDRCRTITEFAQLGEYDDTDIQQLRHSCG